MSSIASESVVGEAFGDQRNAAVAYDPAHGLFLVVWEDWREDMGEGTNADVYGRFVDRDGHASGGEMLIAGGASNQTRPAVAYAGQLDPIIVWSPPVPPPRTGFVVVWEEQSAPPSGQRDVFARWIESGALPVGGAFEVAGGGAQQHLPAVACASAISGCLVAWSEEIGGGVDIYGRLVSRFDFLPLGSFPIATSAGPQGWPAVAYNPAGEEYLAVFQDQPSSPFPPFRISGRRVSHTGALLDNPGTPANEGDPTVAWPISTTGWDSLPAVSFAPADNRYLVAWSYLDVANVHGQRIGPNGALLDPNMQLTRRTESEWLGGLAWEATTSQWLMTWQDETVLGGGQQGRVQAVGDDGAPRSSPERVTAAPSTQVEPAIACTGDGRCLAVWSDDRRSALSARDIYAALVLPSGECPASFAVTPYPGDEVVTPGANRAVELDVNWELANTSSCPSCRDQIVVTLEETPLACIYDGTPSVWPAITGGNRRVAFTAPPTAGRFRLAAYLACHYSCADAMAVAPAMHKVPFATLVVGDQLSVFPSAAPPGAAITVGGYTSPPGTVHARLAGAITRLLGTASLASDGGFEVAATIPVDAPVGSYQVCVGGQRPPGASPATWEVGCVGLTVQQPPPATVHGTVTGSGPLPGATVVFDSLTGADFQTTTGADGRYQQQVPAGEYTVRAGKAGYGTASLSMRLNPGLDRLADFALAVAQLPQVTWVEAAFDRLAGKEVGTFVSLPGQGVEVINRFTATVEPRPGQAVTGVEFTLGGAVRSGTATPGGWIADFDMSALLPGLNPLTVTARDALGAGAPYALGVLAAPPPGWFAKPWVTACQVEWDVFAREYSFTGIVPAEPRLLLDRTFSVPMLGGLRNHFESDIRLADRFSIGGEWTFSADGVLAATVLNYDLIDEQRLPITVTLDAQRQVARYSVGPWTSELANFSARVYDGIVWTFLGIVSVGVSIDVGLHAQITVEGRLSTAAIVDQARITPGVTPWIKATGWVDVLLGAARGGVGFIGALDYRLPIVYEYAHSPRLYLDDECLHFSMYGYAWLKVRIFLNIKKKWKWGPWVIVDWYSDREACGVAGPAPPPLALVETPDSPLFAAPALASDRFGHTLAVWVEDADPGVDGESPTLVWSAWDGVRWSAPTPYVSGSWVSDPALAYDGANRAVAVWTQAPTSIPGAPSGDDVADIDLALAGQEIVAASWNGSSWDTPVALTADAVPDGRAAIAADPARGRVLAAWLRDADGRSQTRGDWDIYWSVREQGSWSAPAPLAATAASEMEVALAFDAGGRAIATWVQDADGDLATNQDRRVAHAYWTPGGEWSAAAVPASWPSGALTPDVAFDRFGRPIAVFTVLGTLPSGYPGGIGSATYLWSAWGSADGWVVAPVGDRTVAEWPQVEVNERNQAIVVFRRFGAAHTPSGAGEIAAAAADLGGVVGTLGAAAAPPPLVWHPVTDLTADALQDWQHAFALDSNGSGHILTVKEEPWEPGAEQASAASASEPPPGPRVGVAAPVSTTANLIGLTIPDVPDLAITDADVTFSDPHPMLGDIVTVTATVHNLGLAALTPQDGLLVRFLGEQPGGGVTVLAERTVTATVPFGGQVAVGTWIFGPCGRVRITVAVNPTRTVAEGRLDNNVAGAWLGDAPRPTELAAVVEPATPAVRLSWVASPGLPPARYQVYRAAPPEAEPALIAMTSTPLFVDTAVVLGQRYAYSVSAVDSCALESARSSAAIVEVREYPQSPLTTPRRRLRPRP